MFPTNIVKKQYFYNKPWLTSALKQAIKNKNKLYTTRNKGSTPESILQNQAFYKKYRNKLHHLLNAAERKYYQEKLLEHKSNIKKSWQVIKLVINKRKSKQICAKFNYNGKSIEDKNTISNTFNNFFINIGPELAKKIPHSNNNPLHYIHHDRNVISNADPVTDEEVERIIRGFNDSAAGWDELRPKIIKCIRNQIKYPLQHLTNLSLAQGIFPNELKIGNVVPIHKAKDVAVFSNYRPVSVLPAFSKLFEKIMYNRLIQFINENKLLYKYQFGFQKGKSTEMALIILLDKITEALDQGKYVIGVFLDFSKAFDTVDHSILLQKLERYGICGLYLDWFKDYLSNRKQCVTYNGCQSSYQTIKCGVPQGSILGPLLFLLYINDLSTVSNACFSILFADDTNMFITGRNINEMCQQLNEDLKNIQNWLCCNKLSLNILKTNYMIFTSRNRHIEDIGVKIDNTNIERVYTTKFLGVQIDSKLTWKNHVDYISKKISKCAAIISKARKVLHKSTLINLYYTFAYPYFIYCNIIWGNTYAITNNKLMVIQKRLIRIVTSSPSRANTGPLFYANKLLNVYDINL